MLSLKRYGWLCVLGGEIFYVACMLYGIFLAGSSAELHQALFALLPGFAWGSFGGVIVGAIDIFVFAWIFAWYYVWMHNTSLTKNE